MRIYWLNPPISTRTLVADTAWMNFSAYMPEHDWITPIIDWEPIIEIEQLVEEILSKNPDVICMSTYMWNEKLCLEVAKLIKQKTNILIIRGGPQQTGFDNIDHNCDPVGAGEIYLKNFFDGVEPMKCGKGRFEFPDISSLEYNSEYLTNLSGIAKSLNKTSVVNFETTRGCPYSCTYCEWGGGIGTKVIQKPLDVVLRELDLISILGVGNIDIIDANFGILNRDVEVIQRIADNKAMFGYPNKMLIYGIAKVKVEKREKILDIAFANKLMDYYSLSIQTIDTKVLDNVKRKDITLDENMALAKKYKDIYGLTGKLELILGLPGYTLDTFYEETNLSLITGKWDWVRGPLTILPATEMANPLYRAMYGMKTSKIGVTENDDNDIKYVSNCVIGKYKSPQEVVVQTNTFTRREWEEMFFMNYAQKVIGPTIIDKKPSIGLREFYQEIQEYEWFKYLQKEFEKLSTGNRVTEDFLLYDGHLIEEWVTKFYINKEEFRGSYN